MSSDNAPAAKKRASASSPKRTPDDDHRRKRRNRPTQSCLNCHTSKRMCDRQRPCGRCTQLGLTGLCVYEVDNPALKANAQDEAGRLKKRVAELESIIRELKNKPHPRWAQSATDDVQEGEPSADALGGAQSSQASASSSSSMRSPRAKRFPTPPSSSGFLEVPLHSSSPSAMGTPSPLNTPSPLPSSSVDIYLPSDPETVTSLLSSQYDFSSLLASYQSPGGTPMDDSLFGDMLSDPILSSSPESCSSHRPDEHCGCLLDHTSYNTVLELSLRLRRATEILARYAKHNDVRSECKVHKGISELDRFTTSALGNIVAPPEATLPQARASASVSTSAIFGRPPYVGMRPSLALPPASVPPHSIQSPRAWDFKQAHGASYPSPPWEDAFMSWEPLRNQPEWPKGGPL